VSTLLRSKRREEDVVPKWPEFSYLSITGRQVPGESLWKDSNLVAESKPDGDNNIDAISSSAVANDN